MANYEKQVEQEAAYPIPISLYNCYRTVRHEKRGIASYSRYIAFLMPHGPVTVVQRYRDGVYMQPLVPLVFHNLPSLYISPSFRRNDFYTCFTDFWLCQCNIGAKKRFVSLLAITVDTSLPLFSYLFHYAARGDRTRTTPLRRYATNLYTRSRINLHQHACARRGTLSKMASFRPSTDGLIMIHSIIMHGSCTPFESC